MKKKIFFLALFAISFIDLAKAQTWINGETDLYPASVNIQQNKDSEGHITDYTNSAYSLGRLKYPNNSSFVARSYHPFDLTVFPDNTQIDEIKVYYSTGSTGYSFKLTKVNSISPTDLGANWSAIGNGNTMDQGISYNTGETYFVSSNIKTQMQNLLTSGEIILGALCENETADNSYSTMLIHLHVKYRYPAESYPYQALNYYKNHTGNGQIGVGLGVPPTSYQSPHQFSSYQNQNINLLAYDYQDIGTEQYLYNDIEAPSNKSKWDQDLFGIYTELGPPQTITVVAKSTNAGATFRAWLKQNCKIDQTHKTEFDGNQTQQNTSWIVEQNSGNISTQSSRLINGKNYLFAGWEDNLSLGTSRNISPTDNKVYDVLYKYPHYSNTTSAYANPNQRRFVKSSAGYFHMVYESMGKIFYERSTNGGQTWQVMNGGKPLNDGLGKYPSIDYLPSYYGYDQVAIVYWEESYSAPPYGYKIIAHYFDNSYPKILRSVVANDFLVVHENSQPVVSISQGGFILVAFNSGSIMYRLGRPSYTDNLIYWDTPVQDINWGGDIIEFKNPTIGSSKSGTVNSYWIAWDNNNTSIKFKAFTVSLNPPNDYYITEGIDGGFSQAGFSKNEQPSISVMPNNDFRLS